MTPPDTDTARFLVTAAGQTLIARSQTLLLDGQTALSVLTRLRKETNAERAAAAWEQVVLRQAAGRKFGPDAQKMLLTREALEQASGRRAAQYHAQKFAGAAHVSDLCGGIGADALAFARVGLSVTVYELDPVRAEFARYNADALGLSHLISVQTADVTGVDIAPGAAWFDPARRKEGRRVGGVEDYLPPLSWAKELAAQGVAPLGVKVSPAAPHDVATELDAQMEFVSDAGECKECLLWATFPVGGAPQGGVEQIVTATLLSDAGPLHLTGTPDTTFLPCGNSTVLYEPDPAVIRAHLVGTLAAQLSAAPVDPHIAYLQGETYVPTPFASAYAVHERFAWSRKRLAERLKANDAGRIIVKKRGFPLEPDDVRHGLKLPGTREWTVVLARVGTGHDVFLCQPLI